MRAVARAHQNRNLADFEQALQDYKQGTATVLVPAIETVSHVVFPLRTFV